MNLRNYFVVANLSNFSSNKVLPGKPNEDA
jgi:hypothetical protein